MVIKIKYFGLITDNLITEANVPEGWDISELLKYIISQEPKLKNILTRATILLNKSKADMQTVLKDEDEVMILAVLGGG